MFKLRFPNFGRGVVPASLVLLATIVVTLLSAAPFIVSAGQPEAKAMDPTCTSVAACLEWVNAGTGLGLEGVAQGNTGASTTVGVEGLITGRGYTGVLGKATSTDLTHPTYGVIGGSSNGIGIIANNSVALKPAFYAKNFTSSGTGVAIQGAAAGNAVIGQSTQGNGVLGITTFNSTSASNAEAGLLGIDESTTSITNAGVVGKSQNGFGVIADISCSGFCGGRNAALAAFSNGSSAMLAPAAIIPQDGMYLGTGVIGNGNTGLAGTGNDFIGLHDQFPGVGVMATGSEGADIEGTGPSFDPGFPIPALLVGQSKSTEPVIIARGGFTSVMSLDFGGNMILAGQLTTHGTPLLASRTSSGRDVVAYGSRASLPSIEDFGEARMVNGLAYVKIGPALAETMDRTASYLVFITPQGPNNGLYVWNKSLAGFEVRENGTARSTLAFDYRIVAKPYDTTAPALPMYKDMMPRTRSPKVHLLPVLARGLSSKVQTHNYNAGYVPPPPSNIP